MRYLVEIGYNGYNFHGWQRQPNVLTIQEVIERNLLALLGMHTPCIGCGRTDAKVHASQFFFHFDTKKPLDFDLKFRLNKMLPDSIAVFNVYQVSNNFHAQHSATSRTYNYLIHNSKNPYLSEISSLYSLNFNVERMHEAALLITQENDFISFCRCPGRHKSTECKMDSVDCFSALNGEVLRFQFTANRFLQGMVRLLMQGLIDVGSGQLSINDFSNLLSKRQPSKNAKSAYPQGLHLTNVQYGTKRFGVENRNSSFVTRLMDSSWVEIKF